MKPARALGFAKRGTSGTPPVGAADPYRSNVVFHVRAGETGIEETTGRSLSFSGSPVRSTARSKFGDQSILFDGSTGQRIIIPDSDDFYMSMRKFTLEGWAYSTETNTNDRYLAGQANATSGFYSMLARRSAGQQLQAGISTGSTVVQNAAGTWPVNTWVHWALVMNGDEMYGFINGVKVFTSVTTSYTPMNSTGAFVLGAYGNDGSGAALSWLGNMDEIRLTRGVARYTANFAPPTERFSTVDGAVAKFTYVDPAKADPIFVIDENQITHNGGTGSYLWRTVKAKAAITGSEMVYWETGLTNPLGNGYFMFGVASDDATTGNYLGSSGATQSVGLAPYSGSTYRYQGGSNVLMSGYFQAIQPGDRVKCAFNRTTGKLWVGKVGSGWQGDPVAGTGEFATVTGDVYPAVSLYQGDAILDMYFGVDDCLDAPPTGFSHYRSRKSGAFNYWRVFFERRTTSTLLIDVSSLFLRTAIGGGASAAVGGTPFAINTESGFSAADAFDGDIDTKWRGNEANSYLGYQFASPVAIKEWGIATDMPGNTPPCASLQYSDDGTKWFDRDRHDGLVYPINTENRFIVDQGALTDLMGLGSRSILMGAARYETGANTDGYPVNGPRIRLRKWSEDYHVSSGLVIKPPTALHPINLARASSSEFVWTIDFFLYMIQEADTEAYVLMCWGGGQDYRWPNIRMHSYGSSAMQVALRSAAAQSTEAAPDIAYFENGPNGYGFVPGNKYHIALVRQENGKFTGFRNGEVAFEKSGNSGPLGVSNNLAGITFGAGGYDNRYGFPSMGPDAYITKPRITPKALWTGPFTPPAWPY